MIYKYSAVSYQLISHNLLTHYHTERGISLQEKLKVMDEIAHQLTLVNY